MRLGLALALLLLARSTAVAEPPRPRARDLGLAVGALSTGPLNAITDVPGVRVGQVTVARGAAVNTGVTAILPHGGNLFRQKVRGAEHRDALEFDMRLVVRPDDLLQALNETRPQVVHFDEASAEVATGGHSLRRPAGRPAR